MSLSLHFDDVAYTLCSMVIFPQLLSFASHSNIHIAPDKYCMPQINHGIICWFVEYAAII